jgi:hypothetical protein
MTGARIRLEKILEDRGRGAEIARAYTRQVLSISYPSAERWQIILILARQVCFVPGSGKAALRQNSRLV